MNMKSLCYLLLVLSVIIFPGASSADTVSRTVSGYTDGGQAVEFEVTVDLTPTGGDFGSGTGTATAVVTLENTTGLFPYQSPPVGNPLLTAFMFNLPEGASVAYGEARVLAGSALYSLGTDLAGTWYPAGCSVPGGDEIHTGWYQLNSGVSTGDYGTFSYSLETVGGVLGGLAAPEVLPACSPAGDIYSNLCVTGPVAFTLYLGNLGTSLDMAGDFMALCSAVSGEQHSSAIGGKFQGTDYYGEDSGFVGDIGYCQQVATELHSWGSIKAVYR
jgi:hypothetical protein